MRNAQKILIKKQHIFITTEMRMEVRAEYFGPDGVKRIYFIHPFHLDSSRLDAKLTSGQNVQYLSLPKWLTPTSQHPLHLCVSFQFRFHCLFIASIYEMRERKKKK